MMITLQKFCYQDYPRFSQLLSNASVMANITGFAIDEMDIKSAWENRVMPINNQNTIFGYYQILFDDIYVGYAKLVLDNEILGQDCIEIGYFLLPEFWGRGIGCQVGLQLIELANLLNLPIIATVSQENHISKKLLRKLGFKFLQFTELDNKQGEVWQFY